MTVAPAPGEDRVSRRLAEIGAEFGHGFALELTRIEAALDALGRPHNRLPPAIHVAGTNGKGSVCAYLRAIFEAAGLRTHVFTSPHLVRVNERIRLAGRLVEDEPLLDALERVAATGVTVTYFEAITAAAFLLFAETPADAAVIEVGLGGRVDATNVLRPAASVITPIAYDHQAFLGSTLKEIAYAKAGIIKAGAPVVCARQRREVMAVLESEAGLVQAPMVRAGVEWDAFLQRGRLLVQTADRVLDLPLPALQGVHQPANAGLAVAAAWASGFPRVTGEALAAGVAAARWPARLQPLTRGPLAAAAGVCELWLDGGHNPHAAQALAASLRTFDARRPLPLTLVLGMLQNKDAKGFLEAFAELKPRVIATAVTSSQSGRDPEALAEIARSLGYAAETAPNVSAAVAAAAASPARILIAGSLYLAGEVLRLTGES